MKITISTERKNTKKEFILSFSKKVSTTSNAEVKKANSDTVNETCNELVRNVPESVNPLPKSIVNHSPSDIAVLKSDTPYTIPDDDFKPTPSEIALLKKLRESYKTPEIVLCYNSGSISSTDAQFAGGIKGYSAAKNS